MNFVRSLHDASCVQLSRYETTSFLPVPNPLFAIQHHAVFLEPVLQKGSRKEIENIAFGYQDEYARRKAQDDEDYDEEGNRKDKSWTAEEDAILHDNFERLKDKVSALEVDCLKTILS